MNCNEGTRPLRLWFHNYINTLVKVFTSDPFVMRCGDHPGDKTLLIFFFFFPPK